MLLEALRRILLTTWVGLYVGLLGLALGAVQLLPLAELGAATFRGQRPDYFFATSYALPIPNLIDLVFPYFFRLPNADYWSLWAKWETELYVGVAPLVLGFVGIALTRRRMVVYFLLLAVVALWLAFASYAPVDLYRLLWDLPGFSAFRVPGRYSYLFVLAWSVLAAFGLQALFEARFRERRRDRAIAIGLLLVLVAGSGVLLVGMQNLRASLLADPQGAIGWINGGYLQLRHHLEGLTAEDVYAGLTTSLDPSTGRTAFGVILLGATLTLVIAAVGGRRRPGVWRTGLAALTACDLLAFGSSLHQSIPVDQLAAPTPAVRFLADCGQANPCRARAEGPGPSVDPQWRVYTPGTLPSMEFDQLVPFRIADIGGYASPDLRRNFAYWTNITSVQHQLVDMANVRYVVYPAHPTGLPSYANVPFDPDHPLMYGSKDAAGGFESYALGGTHGNRLQIVATLNRALEVPQDAVVLQVTVVPKAGEPQTFELRAGQDLSEAAYDRPDVRGRVKHAKVGSVAFERPDRFLLDGSIYQRLFYYAERDLARPMDVERIDIRAVSPIGGVEVYGIGLFNFDTGATEGVLPEMRAKLRQVYADDDVRIFENTEVYPRAYVVPRFRIAPDADNPLGAMLETPFDPSTEVMLDEDPPGSAPPATGAPTADRTAVPRAAEATLIAPDRVVYRVSSLTSGFFVHVANLLPGWRAWVDGRETPILLANALFRAVPISPGEHTVELRYEPLSVDLGLRITLFGLVVAAVGFAMSLAGALLGRRREVVRAGNSSDVER